MKHKKHIYTIFSFLHTEPVENFEERIDKACLMMGITQKQINDEIERGIKKKYKVSWIVTEMKKKAEQAFKDIPYSFN